MFLALLFPHLKLKFRGKKKRLTADVMHSGCCWLFKRQAGLLFEEVGTAVVVSAVVLLMFRLVVCSAGTSSGNMSASLLTLLPVDPLINYYYKILRLKLSPTQICP